MGDGVTSAGNATANQTTNAGQSGDQSRAGDAAQSKFGEALEQESLCPPGLGRSPHVAGMPPRYDAPCHYLRTQPIDLKYHGGDHPDSLNGLKGPTNDPNGPDYKKPIPAERDPNPLHGVKSPDGAPSHDSGLSKDGHILMVPVWGTPREESPEQTPYKPPR
jgi:hypothetical protein